MSRTLPPISESPAGLLWRQFKAERRAELDQDPELRKLERSIEAALPKDEVTARLLYERLFQQVYLSVEEYARDLGLPAHPGFYYEDEGLARRYSARQTQIVPARNDLAARIAEWAWASIGVRSGVAILDLGSGDGLVARALVQARPARVAASNVNIIASDRSQAMLDAHRDAFEAAGIAVLPAAVGDLQREDWKRREVYQPHVRGEFRGFDIIVSQQVHHFVRDRDGLYAGIAGLLAPGGLLVFADDFLPHGRTASDFAPLPTVLDGIRRYSFGGGEPAQISLTAYTGGFIFRRFFLQADLLRTLSEELGSVRGNFPYCYAESHSEYREFAIVAASTRPLQRPANGGVSERFVPVTPER